MKPERMSEIEDGAEPTKGEIFHAVLFTLILSAMFVALLVCFVVRIR
jgi:hypothetical protein